MIDRELAAGARAKDPGNEGRARVCARRAAGSAVGHWLERHPRPGWGVDARARLRALAGDEAFPESVRAAARRLTPRVTQAFALPFPEDPLDDAGVIVRSCLTEDTGPNRPGIEEATL